MLESLRIQNFRLFDNLRIERLGRVNLIVGKNNSGKSCLLEALRVYAHQGSPDLLYELVTARGEHLNALSEHDSPRLDPVRNLFHGYRFPPDFAQAIEIGPLQDAPYLRISPHVYTVSDDDDGGSRPCHCSAQTSWPSDQSPATHRSRHPGNRHAAGPQRTHGGAHL